MSNLHKSNWSVQGNHITLSVPFAKVDHERRLVSGFATLDNLDSQGDIVLAEASANAFARARGNLREMHQPIAAGHLVDFQEEQFYDPETQKLYRGIFVTAYVSKGAESTWEKVLDGTLTGFSIGGEIKDAEPQFNKEANATVRFIKDYDLIELSLVDNPANPLANVFSFQKSAEGSVTVKGMIADTSVKNVFYCNNDKIARTVDAESASCLICGVTMENIGWVETGSDETEKVKEVVSKYVDGSERTQELHITHKNAQSEGGVTVGDNNEQTPKEGEVVAGIDEGREAETNQEDNDTAEGETNVSGAEAATDADATAPVEGEEVAGIDEVADEHEEVQKKMDDLMASITASLEKHSEDNKAVVSGLEEKIAEFAKSVDAKISEFGQKLEELDKGLAAAKSAVSDFEKNLDKFNSAGAIKKSGEVEKASAEKVQKDDDWNGAFSVQSLFK